MEYGVVAVIELDLRVIVTCPCSQGKLSIPPIAGGPVARLRVSSHANLLRFFSLCRLLTPKRPAISS
jgi:hypothetical protein